MSDIEENDDLLNGQEEAEASTSEHSVQDDVRAAFEALKKGPGDDAKVPDTRSREASTGRFKPEGGSSDAAANPPAAKTVQGGDGGSVPAAITPPPGWSAEAKAQFNALPPVVQQEIAKREADMDNGGKQWAEQKQNLLGYFEPLREISEKNNSHPADVIKQLVAASDFLDRDPVSAIQWLAQSYGVNLGNLSKSGANQAAQAYDPRYSALQNELETMRGYIEQQESAAVNSSITSFASAPGHEHFESVRTEMGQLMMAAAQLGQELSLEDAYERAIWSKPEIRAQLTAAPAQNRQASVDKARRGAISAKGAPASAVAPAKPDNRNFSIQDDVRAALESLRAG